MKSVFSRLTTLSLRFRAVTLALVVLVSVAGVVAVTQLKQELIPSIEFPQTIILAQASGMTSDQVLEVITKRMETALSEIDEIVNIETQTTGAFGAVITARNNFGVNQARLQGEIRQALADVWLPTRAIQPPEGADPQAFADERLGDLTPDVLIYLAQNDPNLLFQLSPDVWAALSDETTGTLLAYLAGQTQESAGQQSALRQLVEQEIVPALEAIDQVANVSISGGQALPGDAEAEAELPAVIEDNAPSLLLQLTPEVWSIAAPKAGISGALDDNAVAQLREVEAAIPAEIPPLPESWQGDHFKDASDLAEMRTLTRTLGAVFNDFDETGEIVGALGQTDDLTPETITQMLAIEPSLVEYFKAEQLAAMPDDVFAALPDDYIAGLDAITRDLLAARGLAQSLTGEDAAPAPVDLPSAWKLNPPQLITFSFADLPLATYSISGAPSVLPADAATDDQPAGTDTETTTDIQATPTPVPTQIAEGPALPPLFGIMGVALGIEVDTADDLINLQLPAEFAAQIGTSELSAAQFFNFLMLLGDTDALPEGAPSIPIPGGVGGLIRQISPEAVEFLIENDDTFLGELSPAVYDDFSDDVLALPQIAPPLDTVWDNLSSQPQFADAPLATAQDIVELGGGTASAALNAIDENVPERFAGYEIRLFDSLTPGMIRYFAIREPDFFANLDADVLLKLSPEALALVPDAVLGSLPEATAAQVTAIAAGEQPPAAASINAQTTTEAIPADPNAPPLNAEWATIGNFLSVELDTADDLFRFFPSATNFINSLFDSAQGAAFAPSLLGGLSPEAIDYMAERDPEFLNDLRTEALQLLSADVLAGLPEDVQERAASGGTRFTPTENVTRLNGNPSLLVTVYKTSDANNVEAFHIVDDALHAITAENPEIDVEVSFEQASFVEESISGVAREGGLGAIFAVIVILVFLSGGTWASGPRRLVGAILVALFLILLILFVLANADAAGGDLGQAFANSDVVVRVLLIGGILTGLGILLYPGSLPYPSWRSTLVTAVSIPLSVLMAMALMRWLPGTVHDALSGAAESSALITFVLRLFPESITLNIMTLSGLTVAIGRVVDDSIVVLENIFRQVQAGGDKRTAIITGTRDVSVAIFAATVITVVVFLPLGLTGGIIGEFFLPFGLAVTYALLSSFVVAITVVPVMAYLLLDEREISDEHESWLERLYLPILRWSLRRPSHRAIVIILAFLSFLFGMALFATRPVAFLPELGEPQISVSIDLPSGTSMVDTNELVEEFETRAREQFGDQLGTMQTTLGGGTGLESLILGSASISENLGQVTIGVTSQATLDQLTGNIRALAAEIFGAENVQVSAASLSEQGFGGFSLVLSGPQDVLESINTDVIAALEAVDGLANVTSNLTAAGAAAGGDAPVTYIRIDQQSAVSYTGELETENTLGVTAAAKEAVLSMPDLPASITVSEGFQTAQQTEGFAGMAQAMVIAIVMVIIILIITFGSLIHWLDIILSIVVAPVGAAILLAVTNRVLGISAMIGLLMLIGIVVTNAVVLIDRVQANQRERHMTTYDALVEAGNRRLRPILMTALATIFALVPLAVGLSEGAIIAAELGTVVIGGLFSSTLLTLLIVPVAYMLLDPLHKRISRSRRSKN